MDIGWTAACCPGLVFKLTTHEMNSDGVSMLFYSRIVTRVKRHWYYSKIAAKQLMKISFFC